jgi:hypothetical protein
METADLSLYSFCYYFTTDWAFCKQAFERNAKNKRFLNPFRAFLFLDFRKKM